MLGKKSFLVGVARQARLGPVVVRAQAWEAGDGPLSGCLAMDDGFREEVTIISEG